jgi:hypothetical protein
MWSTLKETKRESMLRGAVVLGLMAAASIGCRRESEQKGEQSRHEPSTNVPPAQPAQPAPAPGAGEPESQQKAIGGGPATKPKMTPAAAVGSLAAANCDHQVKCNDIGPNKKYKTRAECVTDTVKDKSGSINANACPGGINEENLNYCVKALRDADCGNPLDILTRGEACKTVGICKK